MPNSIPKRPIPRSRSKMFLAALAATVAVSALSNSSAIADAFQQAVAEYNAGHYANALSQFSTYKQAYPNNALVRYYMALSHQALNHLDQARAEYTWVAANAPTDLAAKAQTGLSRLNGAKSSLAYAGGGASSSAARGKVRKILEFYADY